MVGANHTPNFIVYPTFNNGVQLPVHTAKEFNAFVLLPL